ncbi:ribophorin I-like [Cryptosporidium canis]|nr:ribophorin I-like [Cryptosporidium canis]
MSGIKKLFLGILALFSYVLVVSGGEADVAGLVSTQVTRTFYLTRRVVRVTMEVKIKSSEGELPGFGYIFSLPEDQIERLASERAFKVEVGDLSRSEKTVFIEYHMGNSYSALPRSIRLGENQLLVFEDELRARSRYRVTKEKIVVQFLAGTIVERTIPANMRRQDNKIVYNVDQNEQDGKFLDGRDLSLGQCEGDRGVFRREPGGSQQGGVSQEGADDPFGARVCQDEESRDGSAAEHARVLVRGPYSPVQGGWTGVLRPDWEYLVLQCLEGRDLAHSASNPAQIPFDGRMALLLHPGAVSAQLQVPGVLQGQVAPGHLLGGVPDLLPRSGALPCSHFHQET